MDLLSTLPTNNPFVESSSTPNYSDPPIDHKAINQEQSADPVDYEEEEEGAEDDDDDDVEEEDDPELEFEEDQDKPQQQPQRKRNRKRVHFEVPQLQQFYHLPLKTAAAELGICEAALKRICRRNRIRKWPYRKLTSVLRRIAELHSLSVALGQQQFPTSNNDNHRNNTGNDELLLAQKGLSSVNHIHNTRCTLRTRRHDHFFLPHEVEERKRQTTSHSQPHDICCGSSASTETLRRSTSCGSKFTPLYSGGPSPTNPQELALKLQMLEKAKQEIIDSAHVTRTRLARPIKVTKLPSERPPTNATATWSSSSSSSFSSIRSLVTHATTLSLSEPRGHDKEPANCYDWQQPNQVHVQHQQLGGSNPAFPFRTLPRVNHQPCSMMVGVKCTTTATRTMACATTVTTTTTTTSATPITTTKTTTTSNLWVLAEACALIGPLPTRHNSMEMVNITKAARSLLSLAVAVQSS